MKAVAVGLVVVLISIGQQTQQSTSANGSISGHIGEYTGINVSLSRYTYDDRGELKLVDFKTARTSSEIGKFGEFRFDNLEPGEYYISANPFGLLSAPKGQVFPATYYPGTLDLAKASRIVLKPADDIRLEDLNFFPVLASAVRIRLVDATGVPEINKNCATLSLATPGSGFKSNIRKCLRVGETVGEIEGIPLPLLAPGTYDVYAGWDGATAGTAAYGAAVRFEVRNIDLDVEAVVSLAHVIGKITIEEPNGSLKPAAGLQLSLQPKRVGPAQWVTTDADGSFRFDRVGPNDFTVEFTGLPADAYIARLSDDNGDVLEDGIEVKSTDVHLDGLISFTGGILEGTITGAHRAIVALIPDLHDSAKHLYRTANTDENGRFTISAIPPGSYRLFSWSKLNGAAYKNADFMKQYESRGAPVVIEKNGRSRIEATALD
jgi:hypothetical protein